MAILRASFELVVNVVTSPAQHAAKPVQRAQGGAQQRVRASKVS